MVERKAEGFDRREKHEDSEDDMNIPVRMTSVIVPHLPAFNPRFMSIPTVFQSSSNSIPAPRHAVNSSVSACQPIPIHRFRLALAK